MSTRRPRYRYVAFTVYGPRDFRRDEILEVLRSMSPRLWLVEFEKTSGLARTTNVEKDAAIRALNGIDSVGGEPVRVKTVGTSGTIRAATRKYGSSNDRAHRLREKNPYK